MMLFFFFFLSGSYFTDLNQVQTTNNNGRMPKSSPNVFTLCGFTAANEGEGFREIRKHSTVQCKKITNIAWQKHQTIN